MLARVVDRLASCQIRSRDTYIVEDNEGLRPTAIMIADGIEDALAHNGRQDLLNEESQEDGGDGGQDKVVNEEQRFKLEPVLLAHPLATTKDDNVVANDEDARLFEGRHWRNASLELEVASRVANDGLPGLVENGP